MEEEEWLEEDKEEEEGGREGEEVVGGGMEARWARPSRAAARVDVPDKGVADDVVFMVDRMKEREEERRVRVKAVVAFGLAPLPHPLPGFSPPPILASSTWLATPLPSFPIIPSIGKLHWSNSTLRTLLMWTPKRLAFFEFSVVNSPPEWSVGPPIAICDFLRMKFPQAEIVLLCIVRRAVKQ